MLRHLLQRVMLNQLYLANALRLLRYFLLRENARHSAGSAGCILLDTALHQA